MSKICIHSKANHKLRISYIWHFELGNFFHQKFHKILIFHLYEKIHLCLKNSQKAKFFDQPAGHLVAKPQDALQFWPRSGQNCHKTISKSFFLKENDSCSFRAIWINPGAESQNNSQKWPLFWPQKIRSSWDFRKNGFSQNKKLDLLESP